VVVKTIASEMLSKFLMTRIVIMVEEKAANVEMVVMAEGMAMAVTSADYAPGQCMRKWGQTFSLGPFSPLRKHHASVPLFC